MNIAVLDDHNLLLDALKSTLETTAGIENVFAFDNPGSFLDEWKKLDFDIAILDIDFGSHTKLNGFIVFDGLKKGGFKGKVLFLSANLTVFSLQKAIESGAAGFIGKDSSLNELDDALKQLKTGDFYIGRSLDPIARQLLLRQKKSGLSLRELEVIQLITQGLSYKEIGEKLFISPRTVEAHRNHILEKLGLSNVMELVRFALKNHLV